MGVKCQKSEMEILLPNLSFVCVCGEIEREREGGGWDGSVASYLVGVDGHPGGQTHHGDAVEAGSVGDRCWGQVVVGLRRVTHQDGVHLPNTLAC